MVIPLYIVEFASPDGVVGHQERIDAADKGPASAWAIIAASAKGVDVKSLSKIDVYDAIVEKGGQMQLGLFIPPVQDVIVVLPARLACPVWPTPNGECASCGRTDCANHPDNIT